MAKPRVAGRWFVLVEAVVSVGAALLLVLLARTIDVNPLDRAGQVSGLAGMQLRFALIALVPLAALIVATRFRALLPLVARLVPATVAGMSTGLIAGAIVIALRGTSWGLNGPWGDNGVLATWAKTLMTTGSMPATYPPGFVHALVWFAELTGATPEHSLKALQIVVTALFGPVAYLAWRTLLSPLWALVLGTIAALPLIEPYKPYANLVLVVLMPMLLLLLQQLRRSAGTPWPRLLLTGAGLGAAVGVLFLVYSGWFVWSAPGVIVAALVVFPWRTGKLRGLALIATAAGALVLVAHHHLFALLDKSDKMTDRYFYFDVWAEPAYIVMWRGDLPGSNPGPWPPPGEFGGVGLYTIILLAGLAAALAVARHRTVVITVACILAGAWVLRFHFGSRMYADDAVQLYPRSTAELLYCLLLASGFAIFYTVRARRMIPTGSQRIGALAALLLLLASVGSATGDRFMPRSDNSAGVLAFNAQITRQTDGTCSAYARTWEYGCPHPDDPAFARLIKELKIHAPRPGELPHPLPEP